MDHKKGIGAMLFPTVTMLVLAIILLLWGYFRGNGEHILGLKAAWSTTVSILPLLVFAFIVAGMVQALLS